MDDSNHALDARESVHATVTGDGFAVGRSKRSRPSTTSVATSATRRSVRRRGPAADQASVDGDAELHGDHAGGLVDDEPEVAAGLQLGAERAGLGVGLHR